MKNLNKKDNSEKKVFDKSKFHNHDSYDRIMLDFDIQKHFHYSYNFTFFPFYNAMNSFLQFNENITMYLTNDNKFENFELYDNEWLVNIDDLIKFCEKIGSRSDKNRIEAFFGQHITIANLKSTKEDKINFLKKNALDNDLLNGIKNLPKETKNVILNALLNLNKSEKEKQNENSNINNEEFVGIFTKFLTNRNLQASFLKRLPEIQIKVLEELKEYLEENLDKSEKEIQEWIDEEKGKYRKTRCLIFGIDYVDPIREGEIMARKRFDILATHTRESHILIELKSPSAEIFKTKEEKNKNEGISTTYSISPELARAIPQILGYKRWYDNLQPEQVEQLGLKERKQVSDCVIVIGQIKDNKVWKENFEALKNKLNIKIWTYTDLIDRMTNTIRNLKENLI